jgi:alpha-tubulin suppressor-like RCC1 family protein
MKTKTILSTSLGRMALPSFLSAAAAVGAFAACSGEFKTECPEGTVQQGGGDVDEACVAAGAGGSGGEAGTSGTGGATSGSSGAGGSSGSAGAGGLPAGPTIAESVLAAGSAHTCARTTDAIFCWGSNQFGELGKTNNLGTDAPNPVPLEIDDDALKGARQIELGASHTCALIGDGRLLCWGSNRYAQLGNSTNVGTVAANPIPTLLKDSNLGAVLQLAPGGYHNCVLRDDGHVLCWGDNGISQLGTTDALGETSAVPLPIDNGALTDVRQLELGNENSCALRNDGRVLCWGKNSFGCLGASDSLPVRTPTAIDDVGLTGTRQIALGGSHSCALRDDGRVLCWGDNRKGQLGTPTNAGVEATNAAPQLLSNGALASVRQIALGLEHSCALRDDGRVLCWGDNSYGQLGSDVNLGTGTPTAVPTLVNDGALAGVRHLAVGDLHSCALREDGRVLCWGRNVSGQLGNSNNMGAATPNPVPQEVQGLPNLSIPSLP